MAIEIQWYNTEKNLMVQYYVGSWKIQDLYASVDTAYEMMASVSHPVDVIIDYQDSDQSISNLVTSSTLSLLSYVDRYTHKNSRLLVMVGASAMLRTVLKVKILRPRVVDDAQFVDTFEEALTLINAQRPQTEQL